MEPEGSSGVGPGVVSSVKWYIRWDHSDSGELRQATLLAFVVLLNG